MSAKVSLNVDSTEEGRGSWRASFGVSDLLVASKKKAEFHKTHAESWAKRYDAALEEAKKTQRVEEIPVTGGMQQTVRFDPGLQNKVTLAQQKRESHRQEQQAFEAWVRFFNAAASSTGTSMLLRYEDVRYFFDEDDG